MDTRSLRRCFYPQWFEPPALILARPRCREGIDANAKRNLFVLRVCLPLLLVLAARSVVRGVDWSACASDLDDVHQASDDATDAAQEADEAQQELESQRSNVESCSDDCESERSDYEDAKDDFEEKSASAENELDNLDLKIRGASASCGYDSGSPGRAPLHRTVPRVNARCALYRRYEERLPLASILKVCVTSMSEPDCRKCLGIEK